MAAGDIYIYQKKHSSIQKMALFKEISTKALTILIIRSRNYENDKKESKINY